MMRSLGNVLTVALVFCAACGRPVAGDEDNLALIGAGSGSALRLTLQNSGDRTPLRDAHGGQLQEAKAIVHAVSAHIAGRGWLPLMEGRVEVDFLRLSESAADLGIAALPTGKVTQLRLYVLEDEAAYVVDSAGERHPLLTPSGSQSGIKIKGNWNIGPCESATLELSTRASKAIHIHGRGADDSYLLRPVIRADGMTAAPIDGCVPGAGEDGVPGGDAGDDDGSSDDDSTPGSGDDAEDDDGAGVFDPEGGGPGIDLDDNDGSEGDSGEDNSTGGDSSDDDDDDGLGVTTGGGLGGSTTDDNSAEGTAGSDDSNDPAGSGDGTADDGRDSDSTDDSGLCYDPEASAFFPCS
ncbi:MAG: DUF4382 domain-containing protein [Myxococcota bacterium]